jgi:hypothetical protein
MESGIWNAECGKWKVESRFNFFKRVEERRKP